MLLYGYPIFTKTQDLLRGKLIGIDLGTTNSVMAFTQGGSATVIPNSEGNRTTPSVVSYISGETKVGEAALRQIGSNPQNTFYSTKRFIGRKKGEQEDEAVTSAAVSYAVTVDKDSERYTFFSPHLDRTVTPEEVSSEVLKKLARDASEYLGEEVDTVVLTVPAYFNDSQRQATRDAAKIAGLKVERIINEPTAAAMAWGLRNKKQHDEEGFLFVFDLGGGTFDISILDYGEDVFEVIATAGDSLLGGDDFDQVITDWLVEDVAARHGVDLTDGHPESLQALQRLSKTSSQLKIDLSTEEDVSVSHPFLSSSISFFGTTLTRTEFETRCENLFERIRFLVNSLFNDPRVTQKLEKNFPRQADNINNGGASTGPEALAPEDIKYTLTVGGSTRIPAIKRLVGEIMGKDPLDTENPDELVALGAALQGAICNKELSNVLLIDVTPLTLGIDTLGNITKAIIPRQTAIPMVASEVFSTAEDNQSGVTIVVCQGERPTTPENKVLGTFELTGIPPARRGEPQIEITFDIDVNGLLIVTASDRKTNKRQQINISGSSNLSTTEIERIVDEAKRYEKEDETRLSATLAAQKAQTTIETAKKVVKSEKNPLEKEITENIKNLIELLETNVTSVLGTSTGGTTAGAGAKLDDLASSVEIITQNDSKLNELLSTIPREKLDEILSEL